ncbi:MAG: leucine-rich repeat protein [Clostridia bacterium]|nr:leucine-rich repeat protein [Clostridia bacterium]
MKKKFLLLFLTIVSAVCLCIGISACGNSSDSSVNGTYYKYSNGSYDYSSYFVLKNGDWSDDSGSSGTYTVSGTTIVFYTELFGENVEFVDGTISDGVLTYYIVNTAYTYCIDGKTPSGDTESGGSGGGSASSQYTVTYNANGGVFSDDEETYMQTVSANSTLTAPTSPTREGYSFAGWATSKNGSTMWSFSSDKVTADITLYASWTEKSAAILSVDNATIDGSDILLVVSSSTESVSLSSIVVCSSDSSWKLYYDKLGQTEIPTKIAASLTGELNSGDNVFYIVVTSSDGTQVNLYTLTVHRSYAVNVLYYNGSSLLKTVTAYTGYTFDADYKPSITGYTFNYWKTTSSGSTKYTATTLWDNLSLYASTTANTYTVTYDVNGGDELTETTATVTYDNSYTLTVPTRTNYTFSGWYIGSTQLTNSNGKSLSAWNYTSDKTLTAKWTGNSYSVTLYRSDSSAGTVTGNGNHSYTSSVTITATTNNGYTWVGWYDENNELVTTELSYTFEMPAEDVVYTAKWTYYTLTTAANDSEAGSVTEYSEAKITVGNTVTITATTNSGYTWVGWYDENNELVTTELSYTFEMPEENVTYTAKWSKVTVVANNSDYGTVTTLTDTYLPGDEVTITATTNSGYTWVGWYNGDTQLTTEFSYTFEMPAENVVYTAKWIETTVTVTSSDTSIGTVSGLTTTNNILGNSVTVIATEVNLGYNFLGWYSDETKLTDEYEYTFTITEIGTDYVAKYELDSAMSNFTFTSTTTTCKITKIIDNTTTEIVVPDYVTSISSGAFSGCSSLVSITLPFVGSSADATSASSSTLFGYIFGTSSYTGGTSTNQYYGSSSSNSATFYIPTTLTTVTITGGNILYGAFSRCSLLKNIAVPNDITSIDDYAFYNCTLLTSIIMPDNLTSIGNSSFMWCISLANITIPSSVETIGDYAFYVCSSLTDISIPDSITSIDDYVFTNCTSLKNVTIGNGVTSIGNRAFSGCTAITNIAIPESVKSIGVYAFSSCSSLTSITIPSSVTSIDESAFADCTSLESINIPDNVTSIGSDAFYYCTSLESVTIGDSVTSISNYAFYGCSSLTSVYYSGTASQWANISFGNYAANPLYYAGNLYLNGTLATDITLEGITTINAYTFYNCTSLTSVTIGDSVTSIGGAAFGGCPSLVSITLPFVGSSASADSASASTLFGYIFGASSYDGGTSTIQCYKSGYYTTYYIPSTLTTVTVTGGNILYGAFYNCASLTSVTIGESVTSIGKCAFSGCSSLVSITLPFVGSSAENATYTNFGWIFGASSYSYNSSCVLANLKTVIITSGTSIGAYAFYNCTSLESVTIGSGVTSIGAYAFYNCTSLESIAIPDSVTSVKLNAFYNTAYYNDSSNWIDNVLYIGTYLIMADTSISGSYEIREGTTVIANYAFQYCTSLESVTIPDSVTSIGAYAFSNCSSLTNVYYCGTASEWSAITIGSYNTYLTNVDIYYYSETEPDYTDGYNYWHYVDGEIVVWTE